MNWGQQQKRAHAEAELKEAALETVNVEWGTKTPGLAAAYAKKCLSLAQGVCESACDVVMDNVGAAQGIVIFLFKWMVELAGTTRSECETMMGKAIDIKKLNRRHRTCYMQFYPAESHEQPDTIESTVAHEMGHLLFLPHTRSEKIAKDPEAHDYADNYCLMSYNNDKAQEFCGYCLLRMRGWNHSKLLAASIRNRRVPQLKLAAAGNFGPTLVGQTSAPMTFTLSNIGTSPLTLRSIAFGAGDGTDFALQNNPAPCVIAPGGLDTAVFDALFTPQTDGSKTVDIAIDWDDRAGVRTVSINGAGNLPNIQTKVGLPVVTNINFAVIFIEAEGVKILDVHNNGNAPLVVGPLEMDGVYPADFTLDVDGVSGQSIPPGEHRSVTVRFKAGDPGMKSANLIIRHNGIDSPKNIPLSGTAIKKGILKLRSSVTTAPGQTDVGQASAPQTLTIRNEGNDLFVFTRLRLSNTKDFEIDGQIGRAEITFDLRMGSNGQKVLPWCFVPKSPGRKTCLVYADWDTDTEQPPEYLTLVGTGRGPAIEVPGLTFGGVAVNTPSTENLRISNPGNAPLIFRLEDIVSSDPQFCVLGGPLEVTVDAGDSANVVVQFTTANAGDEQSATLTIPSNAFGSPTVVTVKGTAA